MTQYDTFTNKGTREINEDRCGVAMHEDSYCFTVADGLGGHGNGEIAAQAAVDAICTMFVDEGYSDSFFKKAFSAAQDAIVQQQERLQAPSRMKTTLVVLVIHKGKAVWAHVGDSRLYEFKQGKMKGRTIDHSVPQMLAISGEIEEKDIRHHLDRNRLMRVMGIRGETPRYDIWFPVPERMGRRLRTKHYTGKQLYRDMGHYATKSNELGGKLEWDIARMWVL